MADRPIECSECKKPATVHYTEISSKVSTCTSVCSDCVFLQQRLYQYQETNSLDSASENAPQKEACKNCGTPRHAIKTHNPVGCSECYEEFSQEIKTEIQNSFYTLDPLHRVFMQELQHTGRKPGEKHDASISDQLVPLQTALDQALEQEDYEQAASLRDQIKTLTNKIVNKD